MSGRGSFEFENHNGKQDVGFDDVAGVDEARAELAETIEFLRDPERFGRLGGRVPRGILLYGPPGTGKTLLARAAAKEAGVAFLVSFRFELPGKVRRPGRCARETSVREGTESFRPALSSSTRSTRSDDSAVAAAIPPLPIRIKHSTSCWSRWTDSISRLRWS